MTKYNDELSSIRALDWLSGGGRMAALIESMDWSANPLGPLPEWSQSLRTAVSLCLSSTFPISIVWGPEMIQLYNDAYRPICGAGHPSSMGQRFWTTWESAKPAVGAVIEKALSGEGSYIENQRMFLERNGYLEEAFMTFSFSPIRDESGHVAGLFHPITETTDRMLSARRTQILRDLAVELGDAKSLQDIFHKTCRLYKGFELDVPFIVFYEKEGKSVEVRAQAGIEDSSVLPELLKSNEREMLSQASAAAEITDMLQRLSGTHAGPYPESPHMALLLPLQYSALSGTQAFALMGISPRRALDDDYRRFYEGLANTLNTAFSAVYTLELEQRRARELAEVDRAKTAFFSNISHELRTPLTLMLGPLEDRLLAAAPGSAEHKSTELIYRNGQRLLKLVNGLLDFSRIEAGRMQIRFSPTPLFQYTESIAYVFRELIEKAGLSLQIEGHEFSEPIFVDPELWERIVLNLLSNAVKYTMEGTIRITFKESQEGVRISFEDTGIGIPAEEMPRLFERFHRVADAKGRTFEGTGIGLSMVQELIRMHGGTITAESEENRGSRFTVELRKGIGHLDPGQLMAGVEARASKACALSFQEMRSWFESSGQTSELSMPYRAQAKHDSVGSQPDAETRILVVEDNNDMRNYINGLLQPHWTILLAKDGSEAWAMMKAGGIDLVVSDVMMPIMNGFELLQNIRQDSRLRPTPFIMLSARAGEEAKVEGFDAGADDYLIKPFSSRELVARVSATLQASRIRAEANRILRERDKRMLAAFEHVSVGMILLSPEFAIVDANKAFCDLTGYTSDELLGKTINEINHPDNLENNARLFRDLYLNQIPAFSMEKRLVKKSGDITWIQSSVSALRDSAAGLEYYVAVVQDVNARKEAEEKAETARRAAERANETKSLFLANMSHEIRTPLGIIQGFTELLLDSGEQTGDNAQWVKTIQRNAAQLGVLIDDILDLSKVEANRMQLSARVFSIREMLDDLAENFQLQAERTGVAFSVEFLGFGPDLIESDDHRVKQVLTNIVGNAFKFTPSGYVKLQYEVERGGLVKFRVVDTGIGLSEESQELLFQAFSQADPTISRSYGGTGLGLNLSKKLARLLGGDLRLESSRPGEGSVFVFTFQSKLADLGKLPAATQQTLSQSQGLEQARILVVDDSSDNRLLITRILKSLGAMNVETASQGQEGVRLALEQPFSVVLMDVQMPEMDGFDAVQKLRQAGYSGRIVALTAHAMQGYREECIAAGFDDYLSKPISKDKLLKSLEPGVGDPG